MLPIFIQKTIVYLRLIRIHRPLPILLLIFPVLIFVLMQMYQEVGSFEEGHIHYWRDHLIFILKVIIGGFCVRSIGCVINDLFDKKFDGEVRRTKIRPLVDLQAIYRPSLIGIIVTIIILFLPVLWILLSFKLITILLCFVSALMIVIYPLTKRFLSMPQIFLGFTYNMGILIASMELLGKVSLGAIILYVCNIFFTFAYDTIYAVQDYKDDVCQKINSSVVKLGVNWKKVTIKAYNISFAIWVIYGLASNAGTGYYLSVLIAYILTKYMLSNLDGLGNDFNQEICNSSEKENKEDGVNPDISKKFQIAFEFNVISMFMVILGVIIDIILKELH